VLGFLGMSTAAERRQARANWPIRRVALRDETLTDARDTSTVDERLALVWVLTLRQWEFAGRPLPTYARAAMPGRLIRTGR